MKKLLLITLSFLSFFAYSQKQTVAYSREYEFKEGIFLTIDDFFNNSPIKKESIITSIPKTELDFMHQIAEAKYISFKDTSGVEQKAETSTIWGYCQNRSIYLNYNKTFNRLNVVGTLCHFTSSVTTFLGYNDPMNANYGINNNYDELRQFVLDTQTNNVWAFNAPNMELVLKNDEVLYTEFMKLKKRQKNDSIFVYLRKYNEKHPLYLNAN